jgi:cytoskeleton protein RodZ
MDVAWLREARERAGFSLVQLADVLEVRPAYVEALERGELDGLLGPTYVQSILTRYAVCVDIDPEQALARYGSQPGQAPELIPIDWAGGREASRLEQRQVRRVSRRRVAIVVAAAVTLAATLGVLALSTTFADKSESSTTAAPTTAVAVIVSSTSTVSLPTTTSPATTTTTLRVGATTTTLRAGATTTSTREGVGAFTIVLTPSADVWLDITDQASGKSLFFGTKKAGEVLTLALTGPAKAVVGKPEALTVTLDGVKVQAPRAFKWSLAATGVTAVP